MGGGGGGMRRIEAVCGASERGAESGWCLLCPETWDVADGLDRNCGVDGAQSGKV